MDSARSSRSAPPGTALIGEEPMWKALGACLSQSYRKWLLAPLTLGELTEDVRLYHLIRETQGIW